MVMAEQLFHFVASFKLKANGLIVAPCSPWYIAIDLSSNADLKLLKMSSR